MPEFILDHGTIDATRAFNALDEFTQGYITAAFFTETGLGDDDLKHATLAELAPEAMARVIADCKAFTAVFDAIEATMPESKRGQTSTWPDDAHAGRDFWYTRNGHGCGFWDGDWPEPFATQLTKAAEQFGETDMYRGDDGKIYLS